MSREDNSEKISVIIAHYSFPERLCTVRIHYNECSRKSVFRTKRKRNTGPVMGPVLYRLLLTFEPDGETSLGLELDVHPRFPVKCIFSGSVDLVQG